MGGHSAGKLASETAVQVFADRAGEIPFELSDVPELLQAANDRIREIGRDEGYEVIGTTLSGIVLVDNGGEDTLLLFNVGDSRCYEVNNGGDLVQLTVDHSYVQELIDRGDISEDEARTHPDRNVVSRAVGLEDTVLADFWLLPRAGASRFLLCSDGLTNELDESYIAATLQTEPDPGDVSALLMNSVAETPARDNTTLIVLDTKWFDAEGDEADDDLGTTVEPKFLADVKPEPAAELIDSVPGGVVGTDGKFEPSEPVVDGIPSDLHSGEGGDA
jgi:protein phosphatase